MIWWDDSIKFDLFDTIYGTKITSGGAEEITEAVERIYGTDVTTELDEKDGKIRVFKGTKMVAYVLRKVVTRSADGCPTCGADTRFLRTALICDFHGVVGGF